MNIDDYICDAFIQTERQINRKNKRKHNVTNEQIKKLRKKGRQDGKRRVNV